jgi:hypothetical protein
MNIYFQPATRFLQISDDAKLTALQLLLSKFSCQMTRKDVFGGHKSDTEPAAAKMRTYCRIQTACLSFLMGTTVECWGITHNILR